MSLIKQRNQVHDNMHLELELGSPDNNHFESIELEQSSTRTDSSPPDTPSTHNFNIPTTVTTNHSHFTTCAANQDIIEEDGFEYDKGHFIIVLGSMIGLMPGWGITSSIGILQSYVGEHQLADVQASTYSWIFSIYTFFTMGGSLVIGPMFDQYGVRPLLIVGMILTTGGLIATSFCYSTYQFILSFGFLVGIGSAFIITPLIAVINHYYIKKIGLMQGISGLGGSLGGVVIPLFLRRLYVQAGWGWAIRALALFSVACISIALLTVTDRTKQFNKGKPKESIWTHIRRNIDPSHLNEKIFFSLIVAVVLLEFSLIIVITYLPSFAIAEGVSESASFLMITVFGISGLFGHIIPTLISDYCGRLNVLAITTFLMTVVTFALWLPAEHYPHKLLGLYFFAVIYGFLVSSTYSLVPAVVGQLSKIEDAGKRFGIVYGMVALFDLASLPIAGKILGSGDVSEYSKMIIFSGAICGASAVAMLVLKYLLNPKLMKTV